jgi:hypothetical protein
MNHKNNLVKIEVIDGCCDVIQNGRPWEERAARYISNDVGHIATQYNGKQESIKKAMEGVYT